MNSKAIKRQLLAAIAMVLVAAIALGSSTYAWFVASGTVTAEGMEVQAQSEGGLAIRYGTGTWGSIASAGMTSATNLYPTSTHNLQRWSHATAKSVAAANADAKTFTEITSTVMDGTSVKADNGYVVMKEFEVRSTAADAADLAKGLYVESITVTLGDSDNLPTQNMSTALRVGVKVAGNQVASSTGSSKDNPEQFYIYGPTKMSSDADNPANLASTTYTVNYKADGTDNAQVTLTTPSKNKTLLDDKYTIPKDGDSSAVKVQIFLWFEGEDHNLYSDNINIEKLSVSVNFASLSGGTQIPDGNT